MPTLPNHLSMDEVLAAAEENLCGTTNTGFCLACGATHDKCEPDAREYECHDCGQRRVFSAEEILMNLI